MGTQYCWHTYFTSLIAFISDHVYHTTKSLITWSILARQTGQPQFFFLISLRQTIHPAMWPQGTQAPSTGASKQTTHVPLSLDSAFVFASRLPPEALKVLIPLIDAISMSLTLLESMRG